MGPFYRPRSSRSGVKTFSTLDECATAWIRGAYGAGRVGKDRMYFVGSMIYSYRNTWPLAKIIYASSVAYVLLNVARISNSTTNHLRAVRGAIRAYMGEANTVFELDTDALANVTESRRAEAYTYYSESLRGSLAAAEKARSLRASHLEAARHAAFEGNRFAGLFGDPLPFPTNAQEALALALHESVREDV